MARPEPLFPPACAPVPPQLAWRPGGAAPACAAVTAGGALLLGSPGDAALAPVSGKAGIACAAWSPDGSRLALGRGDAVAVCSPEGQELFSVRAASAEAAEGQRLQVGGA